MFASFAQGTPGTAPVHNPFATVPSKGSESNPFARIGSGNPNQTKSSPKNPFQSAEDASLSDCSLGSAGKHKAKRGRPDGSAKKSQGKDKDGRRKPRSLRDADRENGLAAVRKPDHDDPGRTTSPSSESSDAANEATVVPYNPADPLSRKIYERLRKDGIGPPPWPSQPGNPNNKQAMARFREQYESYRKKVRVSLTRAGLIDDPEKRKALRDAIEFKGICEDMCPEFEKITRITELDVVHAEKDPRTTFANTSKMVKKLARSAAGQEAPLPMDVRSVAALRRTLDYLLDDLLQNDENLPVVHGFLWDRTRAIRRDFSFFSSLTPEETKTQVYVLENIARFHVTSLHLLSQEGEAPEDFVQQQELEQLGKTLLSLRDVYDDCGEQGIECENESEFRAYYLLFHARDPSILETLQRQWKSRHWRDSDDVRTAVSLVEALQDTHDFHGPLRPGPSLAASAAFQAYFRIVQDPNVSYTMACFAECHFPQLRRSILQIMKRALSRPKDAAKDVTAAALNEFLQFDTVQQAIDFAELHDMEFEPNPENPSDVERRILILDSRRPLPHRRLEHQFSQNMVERKRACRPLPEVIHRTVFEDENTASQTNGLRSEGSLFVQDDGGFPSQQQARPAWGGFATAASAGPSSSSSSNSPFQNSSSLPLSFGGIAGSGFGGVQVQQASKPNPFGTGCSPPQANASVNNPFAAASTGSTTTVSNVFAPAASPFASFVATKKDDQDKTTTGMLGTVSQTPINPFAETSATKSLFGDQKNASQDASVSHQSAAAAADSLPVNGPSLGKNADATSSFSMPPPPTPPQLNPDTNPPSAPSTSILQDGSSSPATFFPAQNQPIPTLGQASTASPSTTHFGSARVDDNRPLDLTNSKDATAAAACGSFQTPAFSEAPKFTGFAANAASLPTMSPVTSVTPNSTLPAVQPALLPDTATMTANQSTNASSAGPSTGVTGAEAKPPPAPPRDVMGDFTRWFVLGDQGLLDEFQIFLLDEILGSTFAAFQKGVAEKRRKEEEDRINQEVERFRRYNLSLKYFYRWKQNARDKRLSALRRSGRDQLRAFYAAQHAAERRAKQETAKKAAKRHAELASVNRPGEFMDMLKRNKMSRREARPVSPSGGEVVSGVGHERNGIDSTVRQELGRSRSVSNASSNQSGDSLPGSLMKRKFGAKTRALREMYLGKPGGFRRSLPSTWSAESDSASANGRSTSNASARWRLKAMGIEQLPDGTAVPESMAHDMRSRPNYYSRLVLGSLLDGGSMRRASISDGGRRTDRMDASPIRKMGIPTIDDGLAKKRKRCLAEDEEVLGEDGDGQGWGGESTGTLATCERNKHKRMTSEAEKLTNELKTLRQELEEGREWFRSQNERLRSE
ncbi:hypothetical protein E4U42_004819 [Claviceps africana]|uniref:SAC3/GANP/THP3 conserved domain-containing protein n=1 Tax=Claviceps africana TaxID=83212 RepID=A0A8K0J4J9_9HYPO|nr:hypothetical protein E4U42_004819 [Claviceps africana]